MVVLNQRYGRYSGKKVSDSCVKEYNPVFWAFIYWADIIYTYIALGIYLSFKYFDEHTRLLQAENIRRAIELKQLNEQLNPHFLFNSLNNIYSHLLRNSSDGRELVLKLSELMRYILDSSKRNTTLLRDEIAFIENYIAFENERLGNRCRTLYSKDIQDMEFKIVPLVLFNFIENAFKHGTTSIHTSEIVINIIADSASLNLFISNDICEPILASTKTGLDNTLRRLELLYPGRHILDITRPDKKYCVSLELKNIV
ncbi:MAG: histidine kinase [Taibaiella sp.]|nr:histidine kinase [Taibaiella sp.]